MNILIIRSSSIQHLALVIRKVRMKFCGSRIDVLTHEHSMGSIKEMNGIESILPYPSTRDFSPFSSQNNFQKTYDIVVIPTSNFSGFGYENVLLLALRYKKKQVILCNSSGELILLPLKTILTRVVQLSIYIPIGILTAFAATTISIVLIALVSRK